MAQETTRSVTGALAGVLALLVAQVVGPSEATAVGGAASSATVDAAEPLPPRLLPDLVALRARDLSVTRTSVGRKLRFETALGSVGAGPVEVRPDRRQECPEGKQHASQVMYRDVDGNGRYSLTGDTQVARRSAGCMVFHPYHDHWHFEAASRYTLYKAARPERTIVASRKMSFCLRDSRRVPSSYGTYRYAEHYGACSRTSPQGISIGWADVYQSDLAGQALLLPPGMGDGLYCLRVKVDPRDQLLETRDNNNSSLRAFYLRGDTIRYRESARCRSAG